MAASLAQADLTPPAEVRPAESERPASRRGDEGLAARYGLDPAELTPAVCAALERLEGDVEQLSKRLNAAEQLADQDPLTPLLNRRAFTRELQRAIAAAERYDEPLCLVYFDLNGFKAINDLYGHAAGDAALQRVAEVLVANVRTSDIVGRLGGDEFAALLTRAEPEGAARRAAELAAMIEAAPIEWEGRPFFLSIAHGLRNFERGRSAAELLAEADAAMYLRKRK
jgi:diguanylate cyclase (GGDEF)-like protein